MSKQSNMPYTSEVTRGADSRFIDRNVARHSEEFARFRDAYLRGASRIMPIWNSLKRRTRPPRMPEHPGVGPAARIRRVKGVRRIGVRLCNWLTAHQGWSLPLKSQGDDLRANGITRSSLF